MRRLIRPVLLLERNQFNKTLNKENALKMCHFGIIVVLAYGRRLGLERWGEMMQVHRHPAV